MTMSKVMHMRRARRWIAFTSEAGELKTDPRAQIAPSSPLPQPEPVPVGTASEASRMARKARQAGRAADPNAPAAAAAADAAAAAAAAAQQQQWGAKVHIF